MVQNAPAFVKLVQNRLEADGYTGVRVKVTEPDSFDRTRDPLVDRFSIALHTPGLEGSSILFRSTDTADVQTLTLARRGGYGIVPLGDLGQTLAEAYKHATPTLWRKTPRAGSIRSYTGNSGETWHEIDVSFAEEQTL